MPSIIWSFSSIKMNQNPETESGDFEKRKKRLVIEQNRKKRVRNTNWGLERRLWQCNHVVAIAWSAMMLCSLKPLSHTPLFQLHSSSLQAQQLRKREEEEEKVKQFQIRKSLRELNNPFDTSFQCGPIHRYLSLFFTMSLHSFSMWNTNDKYKLKKCVAEPLSRDYILSFWYNIYIYIYYIILV